MAGIDDILNGYRVDVDEAMIVSQSKREGEVDRQVWSRVLHALEKASDPFAQMLKSVRSDAVEALGDLIYCDPKDTLKVAMLQMQIQRCYEMMRHIDEFRGRAEAVDANEAAETSLSDSDDPPN